MLEFDYPSWYKKDYFKEKGMKSMLIEFKKKFYEGLDKNRKLDFVFFYNYINIKKWTYLLLLNRNLILYQSHHLNQNHNLSTHRQTLLLIKTTHKTHRLILNNPHGVYLHTQKKIGSNHSTNIL